MREDRAANLGLPAQDLDPCEEERLLPCAPHRKFFARHLVWARTATWKTSPGIHSQIGGGQESTPRVKLVIRGVFLRTGADELLPRLQPRPSARPIDSLVEFVTEVRLIPEVSFQQSQVTNAPR